MDHEEEFLNSFFTQVTQLCFEKAKESVEKERESCRLAQMGPWGMLLMHLPQIALAERSYVDLGFLRTKNKGFLRKDNSLKTMYESLKGDLRRVEEMTRGTNAVGATVAEVSSELSEFVTARIQLMDLLECEILLQLIKAHVEIQNWKFLPSLMALYGAQARMAAWERTLQNKESWKLGFGATFLKANQQPVLYQWLLKLRSAVLSKCSLYFHTTLSQQASPGEMRSIMSRQNVDYYHKLQSFQRKCDVLAVVIVFDSRGTQDSGPGYKHPKREPTGGEDFLHVVSCPSMFLQKPLAHWDNIREGIEDHSADLIAMDKIIYLKGHNQKESYIYAMYNIDTRMTLVTVFESGKQKDKGPHVTTFMTELCVQMRCNKVYESLKLLK
ncbi:KICSTOR complex protein C12orf66 homolog isoform X2 [Belonocnema kinseyi]|uniref:KICSTOR complex protein C12orf66 homolog isoform X2 n=1 Tax=Belonocnema kinseyi TaxID=2817044 RepID=UPI00143CD04F|nr:KICSTOR complex protein C12orf66 homolog isoform X2 [Belonocnema kinseyi]